MSEARATQPTLTTPFYRNVSLDNHSRTDQSYLGHLALATGSLGVAGLVDGDLDWERVSVVLLLQETIHLVPPMSTGMLTGVH